MKSFEINNAFGDQVLEAARLRIDEPFQHHFKPQDTCEGGIVTQEDCMERGLDSTGYDCSGLVIASLCDVLDISTKDWPPPYRHSQQLAALSDTTRPEPGDILLFVSKHRPTIHLGIYAASREVVHASGPLQRVVENDVSGMRATRSISSHQLAIMALRAMQGTVR